jgi:hypothetical protein
MAPRTPSKGSNSEKTETQGPPPDPTQALSAAIAMFDEEFKTLNLQGKIATISGFLGRIPKNGYNKFNNYWYVLESDLVEHVRYWLAAARILVYPESFREHTVFTFDGIQTGQGKQRDVLTDNIVVYRVMDGRTGETFTFEVNGQGSDPRDKGANKASTSAMKFAYLRLFNISSGEDEAEADHTGDQRQAEGEAPKVSVTAGTIPDGEVQRGGKQTKATGAQIKMVSNLSNQLSLGAVGLVGVIKRVLDVQIELGDDESQHGPILAKFLKDQTGEDVGKLIYTLQEMVKAMPGEDDGGGYGG